MKQTIENEIPYEALDEFIDLTRIKLHISTKELCNDCHISKSTYADLRKGKRFN